MLSPAEAQIERVVCRLANMNGPVLIVGEAGVGKRTIAKRIHDVMHSPDASFTEIPSSRADLEGLTTAFSKKGTTYLSEIGELGFPEQDFIVQECSRADKVGRASLVCGASRDVSESFRSARFREDFFYLISAVTLRISPLRCRKPEILGIAGELLTRYSKQFDRPRSELPNEIADFLLEHDWPGNLHELDTAIRTFVLIGDSSIVLAALKAASILSAHVGHRPRSLKEATRAASIEVERALISETLLATGGNRKRAAGELGISYKALLYKLKQAGAGESVPHRNGATR